jgi:hypothetical protein
VPVGEARDPAGEPFRAHLDPPRPGIHGTLE